MKKNLAMFFNSSVLSATGIFLTSILFTTVANAYALPSYTANSSSTVNSSSDVAKSPTAGSTSNYNYNFDDSFKNLVSPFTNFFNNVKVSGNVPIEIHTATNATPNISIGIDFHQYIDQFETWFYNATGVHIDGIVTALTSFFSWLFLGADMIVQKIAGWF